MEKSKEDVDQFKKKVEKHKKNLNFYKFRQNVSKIEPEKCDLWYLQSGACSICEFIKPIPALLSCGHSICTDCVKRIITVGNSKCPFCREKIVKYQAFDVNAMKTYTEKDAIPDTTPPPTATSEDDEENMDYGQPTQETTENLSSQNLPIGVEDIVEATQEDMDSAMVINNVHILKNF